MTSLKVTTAQKRLITGDSMEPWGKLKFYQSASRMIDSTTIVRRATEITLNPNPQTL